MTDSMKFGPEWLRNMSTDTINSVSGTGNNNNSSNSINVYGSSSMSLNNLSGPSGSSNYHSSVTNNSASPATIPSSALRSAGVAGGNAVGSTVQHMPQATRNLFPEFRYGREEMLSLFEKNCNLPEILPTFKKIFIEKVQYPLALVPSTDEEMVTQGPPVPTQRPAWLQRSPVGFSSSTRGTGRGGSVDRGRMRGKSIYHTIYQRPIAMFEDDIRSSSLKSERSWSERNGAAGDGIMTSGGGLSGSTGPTGTTDWNGTAASSPRKEFSSHSRNLENWRRNRNEDGSGDASVVGALPNSSIEGWRGGAAGSNSFGGNHRWGRSTSWRDEEISSGANNDTGYGGAGNTGGFTMQRSYSTISTSIAERGGGGYGGTGGPGSALSKSVSQTSTNYGGNLSNMAGRNNSQNQTLRSGGQWPQGAGTADVDDNLPEWATENPTDGGGTFDASGAFHGSLEHENSRTSKLHSPEHKTQQKHNSSSPDNTTQTKHDTENKSNYHGIELQIKQEPTSEKTKDVSDIADAPMKSSSPTHDDEDSSLLPAAEIDGNKTNTATTKKKSPQNDLKAPSETITDDFHANSSSSSASTVATTTAELGAYYESVAESNNQTRTTATGTTIITSTLTNATLGYHQQHVVHHSDFSDRMKAVADDMVEKLIMDDDGTTTALQKLQIKNGSPPIAGSNGATIVPNRNDALIGSTSSFVPAVNAILKQVAGTPQQQVQAALSVSPTLKAMPLFGGGVVMDHATMQQHHLQQQQLAAAAAATAAAGLPVPHHGMNNPAAAASNDLWYYRDPQSKVQGPFAAIEMTEWYRAGYFNENLYVRRVCDTRFRALGELIKLCHGNMPFTNSHLIPPTGSLGLMDNMPSTAVPTVTAAVVVSPNGSTQSLSIKQQQQNELNVREELKGNVTAAADSISAAMKNLISSVDMSHMLNMHFQMLQEQYIRHHEMIITADLSKNECFQRLPPPEREAIVRQKVQHLGLPEYLTNLTALSNSLATLNPTAGIQLYDAIAAAQQQQQLQQSPQTASNAFLVDSDDFMLNSHQQQVAAPRFPSTGIPSYEGFLTEQQLIAAATTPHNPMMQMWLPHQQQQQQQQPQVIATQQPHDNAPQNNHGQWTGGPLVGMPSAVMGHVAATMKPTSMWDVPSSHEHKQQLDKSLLQQQTQSEDTQDQHQLQLSEDKQVSSEQPQQEKEVIDATVAVSNSKQNKEEQAQLERQQNTNCKRSNNSKQLPTKTQPQVLKDEPNNNQRKTDDERRRESTEEKRRQKEDRRRQQAEEEKRRLQQAEDEKRRQLLEEKERQQQIQAQRRKAMLGTQTSGTSTDNTGNASIAAAGSVIKSSQRMQSSIAPWSMQAATTNAGGKPGPPCLAEIQKAERRERRADQQRQMEILERQVRANAAANAEAIDSMLKWNASPVSLPVKSFAEIQAEEAKRLAAEQLELHRRKQQEQEVTSLTASMNASAGGVGHLNVAAVVAGSAPNSNTAAGNISAIWGANAAGGSSNKVWSAGFWEEPIKFSAALATGTVPASGVSTAEIVATNAGGSKPSHYIQPQQQKLSIALPQAGGFSGAAATRNLRKSQTVSVMQNTSAGAASGKNSNSKNQQQNSSKTQQQSMKSQQQQSQKNNDADKKSSSSASDKKANNNCNINNGAAVGIVPQKRGDDLENEFTTWCMKSLNNMNTKVDVPTFVTFLQDLESPYEVKDYIRMYLGESKEFMEFAKQFLERRSKYKNLQRAQNAHNDDMCQPAPAITPSTGNDYSDNKGKPKKMKKNKMTKLDARILGFSVTAAEGRINVGDRDYVDAP